MFTSKPDHDGTNRSTANSSTALASIVRGRVCSVRTPTSAVPHRSVRRFVGVTSNAMNRTSTGTAAGNDNNHPAVRYRVSTDDATPMKRPPM